MSSGVTCNNLVDEMKKIYDSGRGATPFFNRDHYAKTILNVVQLPGLDDVLDMEWSRLEGIVRNSELGRSCSKGETFPSDLTMMRQDFEMITTNSKLSPHSHYTHFINEREDTHVGALSSFLQRKASESEVRIVCIVGHGLSEALAETLNANPPDFDNKLCKDTSKMKSCSWKWDLTGCNGKKEGLGEGYTARSVCLNAKKGDVVVFAAGFLTPEWIVEQLRKRESNQENGGIHLTSVLLVDSCYSGVWSERINTLLEGEHFNNTRLVVQTSCAADEVSYGQYFIPYWCALQNMSSQGEQENYTDETQHLDRKQTPTLYDSDHKEGDLEGALKFFPSGQSLQYEFNCTVERGAHKNFLNRFSQGKGTIHSYKLKHYQGEYLKRPHQESQKNTPMAFFLVEIDAKIIHLHIHFKILECGTFTVTTINSCETIKLEEDKYTYGEVGTKKREKERTTLEGIEKRCREHVENVGKHQWDNFGNWTMLNTEPSFMIRSRSARLALTLISS